MKHGKTENTGYFLIYLSGRTISSNCINRFISFTGLPSPVVDGPFRISLFFVPSKKIIRLFFILILTINADNDEHTIRRDPGTTEAILEPIFSRMEKMG